ncbi:MAG: sigma factor-like helix-turn-helix DNA-binding protein [Ilumatobacteraceae bacterium]
MSAGAYPCLSTSRAACSPPDGAPAPDRVMVARDELERVRGAIEHLSDEHRETLLLAIAGELSYDEIATMLEIPVGTVKSRVARARRMLTSATTTRSERDDEEAAP